MNEKRQAVAWFLLAGLMAYAAVALTAPTRIEDSVPGGGAQQPYGSTLDSLAGAAADTSDQFKMMGARFVIVRVSADTNTVTSGAAVGITVDSLAAFTVQYSWDAVNWVGNLGTGAADTACNCRLVGTFVNQNLNTEAGGRTGYLIPVIVEQPLSPPYARAIATTIDRPRFATTTGKARVDNLQMNFHSIYP